MKKWIALFVSLSFILTFIACNGATTITPTQQTTLAPTQQTSQGPTQSSTLLPSTGSVTGVPTTNSGTYVSGPTTLVPTTGGNTTISPSTTISTMPTTDFWDQDGNGVPDWQEEQITLRYASWQHTDADAVTIESLMVNAFMEAYPNITVEMQIVSGDDMWDASFLALSEANNLPDVFLIKRLANFLPYNILADVTEYFNNDPDTNYIFNSVKDLGIYNGVRYAVPTFIYPQLWIVNLDILDAAGIQIPSYDWTYEQVEAIAMAATNENTHTLGMYQCQFYSRELPKILKIRAASNPDELQEAFGWYAYTYDGTSFHFDDPVFLTAMNKLHDAVSGGYCVAGLSAATLEEWYLDPTYQPTYNGKVALWREASWSAKNHFSQMLFEWDVYPGPDGITGGNTDIAGISYTSQHKAAAYQLLKWMSYSEPGQVMRFQLFEDFSDMVSISANNYGYPVVDYGIDGYGVNRLWDNIPYGITAPGFVSYEFIESLKNGGFWVNKETVGWDEADSVVGPYITKVINGETTYAAVRETVHAEAVLAMRVAREALDALIEDFQN